MERTKGAALRVFWQFKGVLHSKGGQDKSSVNGQQKCSYYDDNEKKILQLISRRTPRSIPLLIRCITLAFYLNPFLEFPKILHSLTLAMPEGREST